MRRFVVVMLAGCAGHAEELEVEPPSASPAPIVDAYAIPDEAPAVVDAAPASDEEERPLITHEELRRIPGTQSDTPPEPTAEELADACKRGRLDARADDEAGSMHLDAWGYPAPCAFDYWAELRERYEVSVIHHGCVVTPEPPLVLQHRRCYTDEVDAIVMRRHGRNAYERLRIEVERECNRRERRAERKRKR